MTDSEIRRPTAVWLQVRAGGAWELEMETRKRKLLFRATRRGFREMDLYMEAFATAKLPMMTATELDEFEQILDWPDQEVYSWILGSESPPENARSNVLEQLLAFNYAARQSS